MARKSLTISSAGVVEQIADGEALLVGNGIDSAIAGDLALGNTNATSVTIAANGVATSIEDNLRIKGDLFVEGTTHIVESETVLINDSYLNLNNGYTTQTFAGGGLVVNVEGGATTDSVANGGAFVAGVAATSNPTVKTTGSATFAQYDIIQINGSAKNDGIYEVQSHVADTLTVRGIGTVASNYDFFQNNFEAETAGNPSGITIVKVYVSVIRAAEDTGAYFWEAASHFDTTGAGGAAVSFVRIVQSSGGAISLQEAYESGNAIVMTAPNGAFSVTGANNIVLNSSTGTWTASASSTASLSAGAKLLLSSSLAGADAVELSATNAAGGVDIEAGAGGILLDADAIGDGLIKLVAGAGLEIDANNASGFSIDGTLASNVSVTGADLTVSTITSGQLNLSSAAAVVLTADLGGTARTLTLSEAGALTETQMTSISLSPTGTIDLESTASNISLDALNASNFNVSGAGQDLTLESTAGSTNVKGGEADDAAVHVYATNAAGGVLVQSGSAGIDLRDPVATLQLDGAGNLTDAGDVLAGIDLKPTGAIILEADAASHFKASAGDLTFDAEAGSVLVDAGEAVADAIKLHASAASGGIQIYAGESGTGSIDMDVGSGGFTLDSLGAFSIDGVADSNMTVTAAGQDLDIAVAGGGAQELRLASAGTGEFGGSPALQIAASAGGFAMAGQGDSAVQVTVANKDLSLLAAGGGTQKLILQSAGTGADAIDIDASAGGITVDAVAGAISIQGALTSDFTVAGAGQSLDLAVSGGGAQQIHVSSAGTGANAILLETSAGGIDVDAFGNVHVQAGVGLGTGTMTLTADGNVELSSTGAGAQTVDIKAPLNGEAAIQIGGADKLLARKDSLLVGEDSGNKPMPIMLDGFTSAALSVGEAAYISGNNTLGQALADAIGTSRVAGIVGESGSLVAFGVVDAEFEAGLTLAAGDAVYLSKNTAGLLTNVAPSAQTEVVAEVGLVLDASSYVGVDVTARILLQVKSPVVL